MPVFISPFPLPSFFRKRAEQNFSALLSRAEMDFSTVISALVQSSTALGRPESALGAKNGPVPSGLGRRNTPFSQTGSCLIDAACITHQTICGLQVRRSDVFSDAPVTVTFVNQYNILGGTIRLQRSLLLLSLHL